MSIVPVIKQMITLSLLMLTGFFANRFGILGKDAQKWMSKLIINITCPALILSSVTTSQRLESNRMVLVIFGAAIVYYLILPFLAKGCALVGPRNRRSEYACMLIYSNLGFMGIPVANAVLGKEAILYISILWPFLTFTFFPMGSFCWGEPAAISCNSGK